MKTRPNTQQGHRPHHNNKLYAGKLTLGDAFTESRRPSKSPVNNRSKSPSKLSAKEMSKQDILSLKDEKEMKQILHNSDIYAPLRIYHGYGAMVHSNVAAHSEFATKLNLKLKINNKNMI